MSADLDGGAAPASLDELIVVDSQVTPADDGGAAPQDDTDTDTADADAAGMATELTEAEDAGPAPAQED